MLTVLSLDPNACGVSIRNELSRRTHQDYSLSAIYTTLSRLQQKKLLATWLGAPSAERGGRAKRYFEVTDAGRQRLIENLRVRQQLSFGLGVTDVALIESYQAVEK